MYSENDHNHLIRMYKYQKQQITNNASNGYAGSKANMKVSCSSLNKNRAWVFYLGMGGPGKMKGSSRWGRAMCVLR